MGSIPRIVSTPLKWVSKQILNRTLLRFPGGNSHDPIACTYCPEMCRFACPTAVTSGNDAVTPCNKMSLLHKEDRWPGQASKGGPLWPIYDCTGCGRCTEFCVYDMPVGDTLFKARGKFGWDHARKTAAAVDDRLDLVGDLAEELGDEESATRRMGAFLAGRGELLQVDEPRSVYFLTHRGFPAQLNWNAAFDEEHLSRWVGKLAGKTWLVHESVWLSRRLDQGAKILDWVKRARQAGVALEVPFQHAKDCIDCGGEGAYHLLFPEQSERMARDFWERDKHRAQGILCFSSRCAAHLKKALGNQVPVISLSEMP